MNAGGAEADGTRAGYVALVGRPNAGKSTLLNTLIGEKLSIVTPRAQTTRDRVTGILTREDGQVVFVDTPGLLEPRYLLQQSMLEAALSALRSADATLLLLDGTRSTEDAPPAETLEALAAAPALHVGLNKTDVAEDAALDAWQGWAAEHLPGRPVNRLSAATGAGVDALLDALVRELPPSPYLFPEDDIAVQPVRFFVAELVRETLFEELREEVPYSAAVAVEEFREADDPLYIRATIYVERESQKAIVVGKGGREIRGVGARSRQKIESFLGRRVYLDLWVKTRPGWRKKKSGLREFGYELSEGG